MGTHWMQATGIFPKIMDPYMNALPEEPLRRLRDPDSALQVVQIIMLFMVWGFGTVCAIIAFVAELGEEIQRIFFKRNNVMPIFHSTSIANMYRVTHVVGENLQLTWVLGVPSSCLGSR